MLYLFCFLVVFTNGYDTDLISPLGKTISKFLFVMHSIIVYAISGRNIEKQYSLYSKLIKGFALLVLTTALVGYFYENHDWKPFVLPLSILLYYILHAWRVNEKTVISSFVLYSLVLLFIQIIQIMGFIEPHFGLYYSEDGEMFRYFRNGIERFNITGVNYVHLPLFYFLFRLLFRFKIEDLFYTLVFTISIYLSLTRQLMLVTVLAPAIIVIMGKARIKFKYLIIIVGISLVFLLRNYEMLFSSLMEDTSSQINDDDYIRFLSGAYFFSHIFDSIPSALFGHIQGMSVTKDASSLISLGYFPEDVGLIGLAYTKGLIYVALMVYTIYSLGWKYRSSLSAYSLCYTWSRIIVSIMLYPFAIFIIPFMLYLGEIQIREKSLTEQNYE